MRKKVLTATLFVAILGGFIGFNPNVPNQTVNAGEVTMIRWIDVPKVSMDIPKTTDISIDLQNEDVRISSNAETPTTVSIQKEIVEVPVVEYKPIEVRNYRREHKLLNKVAPLTSQKINVNRNQNGKTGYKGYKP